MVEDSLDMIVYREEAKNRIPNLNFDEIFEDAFNGYIEAKTEEELLFYVLIPIGTVLVILLTIILKRSKHFQN